MKNLLIILLLVLVPMSLWAWKPDKWEAEDTLLQGIFITFLILDCNQTYYRQGYKEENIILGEYPSNKKVNLYFISYGILHTGIAYILPKPYRNYWQLLCIGVESNTVYYNYKIGIKFQLP